VSGRSVPFHCPYCASEDLRPHEVAADGSEGTGHGAWECHACLRAFRVSLVGQLRPPASVAAAREERRR